MNSQNDELISYRGSNDKNIIEAEDVDAEVE